MVSPLLSLLPMMTFGEPPPQEWAPQSFAPQQHPQQMPQQQPQMPMDLSAQARQPQQQANPLASLFGGGGGGGGQGFSDVMSALGTALMMGSGDPNFMKIGAAMSGQRSKDKQTRQQQNQTVKWLVGQGVDQETAQVMARDPAMLRSWFGEGKSTSDIKEYEYAKKQGFNGSFQQWQQSKRAGAGEYGLQPIWGTDAQGNPTILQLGKSGEAVQSKLPEGVKVGKDVIRIDAGTHTVLLDPVTRQQIGMVPKNQAEAAAQQAEGRAQGEARAQLPSGIAEAERAIKEIDQLMVHKGLPSIVGPLDQFRPSWTLGDEGRDALARYNQLKGRSFLQAYQTLKGGGQITEIEGLKAENAMARMDRAQSEAEFKAALKDFRDAIQIGMQKLRERAGAPAQQSPSGGQQRLRFNPQTGDFE